VRRAIPGRRRRRHEEQPEHIDRWLVSYADFITLMFAFFVVLYAISQVNEGKYRVLSDALVSAFRDSSRDPPRPGLRAGGRGDAVIELPIRQQGEFARRRAEARLKAIAEDMRTALDPLVREGQVRVTETPRGIAVDINASLLFAPGQAELAEEAQRTLGSVAEVLSRSPNLVEVEGHTDNSPIASSQYPSNWELSAARASRVVRLLAAAGVAPARMVAVGYGEFRGVEDNTTPEGRARNRRVTVTILRALEGSEGNFR
jgi:chemotaxis protein MotB